MFYSWVDRHPLSHSTSWRRTERVFPPSKEVEDKDVDIGGSRWAHNPDSKKAFSATLAHIHPYNKASRSASDSGEVSRSSLAIYPQPCWIWAVRIITDSHRLFSVVSLGQSFPLAKGPTQRGSGGGSSFRQFGSGTQALRKSAHFYLTRWHTKGSAPSVQLCDPSYFKYVIWLHMGGQFKV